MNFNVHTDRAKSVAVCGNNHDWLVLYSPFNGDYHHSLVGNIIAEINHLYMQGYRHFFCGITGGFELAVADALVRFRESCPDMKINAVIPEAATEYMLPGDWLKTYLRLKPLFDDFVFIERQEEISIHSLVNSCLVFHSDVLLTFDCRGEGRVREAVTLANAHKRSIINLCPYPIDKLPCDNE